MIQQEFGKELDNPNRSFGILESLIKLIAGNWSKSLIIYIGPDTGKRNTVKDIIKKTLTEEGIQENSNWFLINGKVTAFELYRNLYMYRKGHILVFDDSDSFWKNTVAVMTLKQALETRDDRTVQWHSTRTVDVTRMDAQRKKEFYDQLDNDIKNSDPKNPPKFPNKFDYEGRIIFLTNIPIHKVDSSILSRSAKIDMSLTTVQ